MTDETQATAAQDTTAATQAEATQSDSSLLTPPTEGQPPATEQDPGQGADTTAEGEGGEQDDQGKETGAPEEYADFTLAEGIELDADVLTEFKGLAKELGITQDAAQKLIDLQTAMESKRAEAYEQALADQSQQWMNAIKNDPEFGGEQFDDNVALAVKTIETFGSTELRDMLRDSGLGNHPELVKFCHRIGKAISEDGLVMGGTQAKTAASTADVLFGDIKLS